MKKPEIQEAILDPWIIDEIRRREEEQERPSVSIDIPYEEPPREDDPKDKSDRGVVIIDQINPGDDGTITIDMKGKAQ